MYTRESDKMLMSFFCSKITNQEYLRIISDKGLFCDYYLYSAYNHMILNIHMR